MPGVFRPGRVAALVALAVPGFFFYGRVLSFPFVHDDIAFIVANRSIGRWDNILAAFFSPLQSLGDVTTPYYRPVLELLNRFQYAVFGMHPGGFHGVNVLVHVVNAWLVFLIAVRLRAGRKAALAGAALFLLHPVQSQAVACVSGMSNLAVTLLVLLGFYGYITRRWVLTGVCFVVALFTKETALVFPGLVMLYEGCRRKGRVSRPSCFVIAGLMATLAAFWWWRGAFITPGQQISPGTAGELKLRVFAIPSLLLMDARLLVFPAGLHYYRCLDILRPALVPALVFLSSGLFMAAGLMRARSRVRRAGLFGLGWALIALFPVLGLVPLINEYSFIQAAEHFLYLPLAGGCVALALLTRDAFQGSSSTRTVLVSAVVLLCAGVLTSMQTGQWRSERALFERAARFEPGFGRVQLLLAQACLKEGRLPEARQAFGRALQIMDNYVKKTGQTPAGDVYRRFIKIIYEGRAQAFLMAQDPVSAEADFRAVLGVRLQRPGLPEVNRIDSSAAGNVGMLSMFRGDNAAAGHFFQLAVVLDPESPEALNNMAIFVVNHGDKMTGQFLLDRALKVAPGYRPAWENLKKLEERN